MIFRKAVAHPEGRFRTVTSITYIRERKGTSLLKC